MGDDLAPGARARTDDEGDAPGEPLSEPPHHRRALLAGEGAHFGRGAGVDDAVDAAFDRELGDAVEFVLGDGTVLAEGRAQDREGAA